MCWCIVVTLACLLEFCMRCLAERRCTVSSLWMLVAVCESQMMIAYSKMGCRSTSDV